MEIVRLKFPQTALFVKGGEQLTHRFEEGVHGAADIHEQEESDVVFSGGSEDQFNFTRVLAGFINRFIESEFGLCAPPRQLAQPPKSHAKLSDIDRPVGSVIGEPTFFGDLHRRTRLTGSTDANAGRVRAAMTEGRSTTCADPFVPAIMLFGLLLETLEEFLHQLVTGEFFEFGKLLRGELGQFFGFLEPLQDLVGDPFQASLDTAEDFQKDTIIGIELGL